MNLFALTDVPGSRILRFSLTQELQQELADVFGWQLVAFFDHCEIFQFDAHFSPGKGELCEIAEFEDPYGLGQAVANPLGIQAFDPQLHSLADVKALFAGIDHEGRTKIAIQIFEKRRLLLIGGFAIFFSQNTFRRATEDGLILDRKVVAVLDGERLIFQSFHIARRIFALSQYFAEATDDEVREFITGNLFHTENVGQFLADASALVRKKIALISKSAVLEQMDAEKIVEAAKGFPVTVVVANGKIALPSNKTELRNLLTFLDEDYYESALSKQMWVSTSRRKAE